MKIYAKGKRIKKKKGKIITIILLLIIIACSIYLFAGDTLLGLERKNETDENTIFENFINQNEMNQNTVKIDETVDVSNIPKKIGSYQVVGQIVIDKLKETKNIIDTCDDTSLNVAPGQQYGPNINKPGNVVICGHNWDSMFKHLSELKKGDTFYLINSKTKTKVKYKIAEDAYISSPKSTTPIKQTQNVKREVTLYTCTSTGLERIICKAYEVE